ncbi:TIGR01458 family HAD-type hydrolase [Motiliproteus sediminis]|uniref:TIGR01458 family HAD-type hydrolase n=1 Tax=Motiliproteus sediminis TaxID=1468178 RepID=UPI001AF00073|nr:TIGR01458 family HAD-type hydrolase [Motiliproteus sediminis]
MYQGIFFDLSGVLYSGHEALPGAAEALALARAGGVTVRFVTNTSRRTGNQLVQDLAAIGLEIEPQALFTAPRAAHDWVVNHGLRPYCLIHDAIRSEFADLDQHAPNAVVVGDAAEGFSYAAMDRAFQLCHAGAPLIGIGRNRYFRLDDELHLDAGAFVTAIEYAAGCEAVIIGKPSAAFFAQVLASTGLHVDQVLMVGDDVHGDVEGALAAGLGGCLVRTGKYEPGDEQRISGEFQCVASVTEAVELALSP